MVLWEITAATAYFLGLKRTYKLALKIQRRLIGPEYPKIRRFLHRRTRGVFDIALTVHRNIQQRDLEVGKSLGSLILRFLDKMKPSANIRGATGEKLLPPRNTTMTSNMKNGIQKSVVQKTGNGNSEQGSSDRHLFSAARNTWHRSFPTITMIMQPNRATGTGSTNTTQFRHLSAYPPEVWRVSRQGERFVDGVRPDILMWMQRK